MSLQKKLDSLQPYVIGIRYLENMVVVDAVFKDGWIIPESQVIQRAKGNDTINYLMLFSEVKGIGLDELLEYVDQVIKLNRERELKHELLKTKVNEMKEIFKKTPLNKLHKLKFIFDDDDLTSTITDIDLIDEINDINDEFITPEIQPSTLPLINESVSEEELEMIEEERRAEIFFKRQTQNKVVSKVKNVELPPKKVINIPNQTIDIASDCECGDDEACDKCIHNKDL